ncbi:MAG: nitroreductase family deazaflavin-dependent oxidoreductase [Thermoleophilia bacterium]|nr:nitroreductase family deazaflavin-dependent oxidoreductase [Thermoleophilia bacterium]
MTLAPLDVSLRDALLERVDPALCAAISTVRPDGSPRVVPVWYRWDGERILVWSGADRHWVRDLRAEPRVALSVHEHTAPWSAVVLRGRASVRAGPVAELRDETEAIVRRYVPAEEVASTIAGYDDGSLHALVTIEPGLVDAWATPS